MNEMSLFGPRLKAERKRLGFSQDEIADAVGVSREMWGKYERGSATPGGDVLARLVSIGGDANFVLSDVAALQEGKFAISRKQRQVLQAYEGLNVELQDAVDKILSAIAGGAPVSGRSRGASQVIHGSVGQVIKGGKNMKVEGGSIHVGDKIEK